MASIMEGRTESILSKDNSLIYVARDIERALGMKPIGNYFIITNKTPYSTEIQKQYPENVILINKQKILNTFELLVLPETQALISKLNASILVFKNTIHIENLCIDKGWRLLNPSAILSEKIENKISQVSWLGDLASLLPKHFISLVKDIPENILDDKKVFVLQWSHGHTGDGTILLNNKDDLKIIKEKFPERVARITDFIKGPMFTVNIVMTDNAILMGNISYQITGMLPFTENPFSTVGNDWSIPHSILTENHIKKIEEIVEKIGQRMQTSSWRGLFGIDIIYDEERDTMNLIEINTRQPASTTYESELQHAVNMHGVPGISIFEAHIIALLKTSIITALIPINDGAQIVQRVTRLTKDSNKINEDKLINAGYKIIKYSNTKENSDLLRIQSNRGIMEKHNKFNSRGKEILDLLL